MVWNVEQSVERSLAEIELQAQMDTQESESIAMEKALQKLDALVSDAMTIEKDPSSPERLSADIEVAAAAKQALQLLSAIQVRQVFPSQGCMASACLPQVFRYNHLI